MTDKPDPAPTPAKRAVCASCGSEDVLADAYAEWDPASQCWTVQNVFEKGAYCHDCDGECRIEMVPAG